MLLPIGVAGMAHATPVYLNDQNITVRLGSSHNAAVAANPTSGPFENVPIAQSLANVIDAPSADAEEFHNQSTHIWVSGGHLELDFDFRAEYDLTTLHFWNYHTEAYAVNNILFTFYDGSGSVVGTLDVQPALGNATGLDGDPLFAEDYDLAFPSNVRYVNARLTGTNDEVDFNNIGFTAVLSDPTDPGNGTPSVPELGWLQVVSGGDPIAGLAPPRFELILDASGSMRQALQDDKTAIEVAKQVTNEIIEELPTASEVALRVYGHRVSEYDRGDCQDSELLFPFQRIDKARLKRAIAAIDAKGTTPLSYSLVQAAKDLVGAPGEKLIVLVTDGEEYCGADPEAVVQTVAELGMKIRLEVVGFALADEFVKQEMQRIADVTGGDFHDAQGPESLKQAVHESIAAPFDVLNSDGKRIAAGIVGGEPIELPSGLYRILVRTEGHQPTELPQVRIAAAEVTEIDLSEKIQPSESPVGAYIRDDRAALPPDEAAAVLDALEREVLEARAKRPPRGADPRIYRVQRLFTQLGFDPGPADGLWGRKTAAAVRAFQERLPDGTRIEAGELDDATYRALIEAAKREAQEEARGQ